MLTQMNERVKSWQSQHKRIQCYVTNEEYEEIEELALHMGLSLSELVKKAIVDLKGLKDEAYVKGFDDGFESALEWVEEDGPTYFGIEVFAVPCKVCSKPMVFSSKDEKLWEREVKPVLQKAFSNWIHVKCKGRAQISR